jgi:PAS domain-containing protein
MSGLRPCAGMRYVSGARSCPWLQIWTRDRSWGSALGGPVARPKGLPKAASVNAFEGGLARRSVAVAAAAMSDQVLFSIGEVASIVGLSPHTIRAWERRHGLLRPQRTSSGQRRYTTDDMALLLQVKHATARHGVSLKVAARSAQGELSVPAVELPPPSTAGAVIGREPVPDRGARGSIWRAGADLMAEMMVILDIDGSVSAANQAASEVFGVPPDQIVGRQFADLLGAIAAEADLETLLQRAYVQPTTFERLLQGPSTVGRWAFDCRPFTYEGRPRLAVFARETGRTDGPGRGEPT